MMFHRIISLMLLVAFVVVSGAAAVHVHEHHESATTVLTAQADDGGSSSECGLCHVTKERAVHTTHHLDAYSTTVSTLQQPLVANLVSDRCPLRIAGRAPPGR